MLRSDLFSKFEILRAHVEAVVERSTAIMVTSAKMGDGASLTAHGLAERLADNGRHVVLVRFQAPGQIAWAPQADLYMRAFPVVTISADEASPTPTSVIRARIEELRAGYDYTIVDAAPLLRSRISTILASQVDAILVTVRLGRTSGVDDTAIVDAQRRTDGRVLGVVAAAAKDIDAFGDGLVSRHPGDSVASVKGANSFPALERSPLPAFEGPRQQHV